jgi:hypothetical protein
MWLSGDGWAAQTLRETLGTSAFLLTCKDKTVQCLTSTVPHTCS